MRHLRGNDTSECEVFAGPPVLLIKVAHARTAVLAELCTVRLEAAGRVAVPPA
jgi:hypothetical protein